MKITDTPRTDEVLKAASALPFGSMTVVPDGHPPCDPWELARQLEIELKELHKTIAVLKRYIVTIR